MKVGQYCIRDVISIPPEATAADAARLMYDRHVGFLVAVDQNAGARMPIGVLTDRDIVMRVNARDLDHHALAVKDIMTPEPLVAHEQETLSTLLQRMRAVGVRRAPVVDESGALVGIIAFDDILAVISELLGNVCGSIHNEQRQERRFRIA